jgi:hypothetical protein
MPRKGSKTSVGDVSDSASTATKGAEKSPSTAAKGLEKDIAAADGQMSVAKQQALEARDHLLEQIHGKIAEISSQLNDEGYLEQDEYDRSQLDSMVANLMEVHTRAQELMDETEREAGDAMFTAEDEKIRDFKTKMYS